MQAPEPTPTSQPKEEDEDEDDLPELPWKNVTSAAALPDGTDLDDKNHVQTADKAVAAPPAVMKPKSYAAVAKALVVTAARAQPAAVPLKPSGATPEFAADNPAEAEAAKPRINAKVVSNVIASKVRHCLEYPTSIYLSLHLSVYLSSYPPTFLSIFLATNYLSTSRNLTIWPSSRASPCWIAKSTPGTTWELTWSQRSFSTTTWSSRRPPR